VSNTILMTSIMVLSFSEVCVRGDLKDERTPALAQLVEALDVMTELAHPGHGRSGVL
jgi:hypothetical protein